MKRAATSAAATAIPAKMSIPLAESGLAEEMRRIGAGSVPDGAVVRSLAFCPANAWVMAPRSLAISAALV